MAGLAEDWEYEPSAGTFVPLAEGWVHGKQLVAGLRSRFGSGSMGHTAAAAVPEVGLEAVAAAVAVGGVAHIRRRCRKPQ